MLHIERIKNGIVIDHIKAGQGIHIFNWLGLSKAAYNVAFLINASSRHMGRKDIIKIDNTLDLDFAVLGLIDPNITVDIIENEHIVEKRKCALPERVENVLICRNPRCITAVESNIPHIFNLANRDKGTYRCEYCDEMRSGQDFR